MTTDKLIAEVRRRHSSIDQLRQASTKTDEWLRTAAPALADAVERLARAIGELPAVRGMPPGKHYVEVDIDIIDHLFGLAIECGAKLERRST